MMTKTLIILALTANVFGVAENTFAAETDIYAASHGEKATEIKAVAESGATGNLDGYIAGQFLPGMKTDFVKGVSSSVRSASRGAWNGFITGTAALAPRETVDVAIVPSTESKGKKAWEGYVAGSFGYWQRRY